MLYIFEKDKFISFSPFIYSLPKAGFTLTAQGEIKKNDRTWALYGCDDSAKKCVLWISDDPRNPLAEVCFEKAEKKGKEVESVKRQLRALKIHPDIAYLDASSPKRCEDGKGVSFVILPKMFGAKHVNEINTKELVALLFAIYGVSIFVADLLELR